MRRSFGCEFEFSSRWGDAEEIIRSVIPRSRLLNRDGLYKSVNNKKWHLKTDSTTVGEVVTPVSTTGDIRGICDVVGRLREAGIRTSRSDGLHVHVWAGDLSDGQLVAGWLRIERAMFGTVPRHRRRNLHCPRIGGSNLMAGVAMAVARAGEHHAAISITGRRTVEVRIAEGTFDPAFIKAWIRTCVAFVEWCKSMDGFSMLVGKPSHLSLEEVIRRLRLNDKTARILRSRRRKFGA